MEANRDKASKLEIKGIISENILEGQKITNIPAEDYAIITMRCVEAIVNYED